MVHDTINTMDLANRLVVLGETESFLKSVTDLLTGLGWSVEVFTEPVKALTALSSKDVSLLLAEHRPGGRFGIDFLKTAQREQNDLMMVLMVPAGETTLSADLFDLPIVTCLISPITADRLQESILMAKRCRQTLGAIHDSQRRIGAWEKDLAALETSLRGTPRLAPYLSVDSFLTMTFQNILGSMMDVRQIADSFVNPNVEPEACHLFNCSRMLEMTRVLRETVDVLEKTKHAFKSRELGLLRQKLEQVISGETKEEFSKVTEKKDDI